MLIVEIFMLIVGNSVVRGVQFGHLFFSVY